jgi:hypothetical protein
MIANCLLPPFIFKPEKTRQTGTDAHVSLDFLATALTDVADLCRLYVLQEVLGDNRCMGRSRVLKTVPRPGEKRVAAQEGSVFP